MELAVAVRDVLLVPRCAGCGEPGSWFCVPCRVLCDPVAHDGRIAIRAAGAHAGPLRAAVRRLKYGGEPGVARDLGALVAIELARDLARGVMIDAIVPVPLHRSRAATRGYDQAALLGQAVAAHAGLPLRRAGPRRPRGRPPGAGGPAAPAAPRPRAPLPRAGRPPRPPGAPRRRRGAARPP